MMVERRGEMNEKNESDENLFSDQGI